MDLFPLDLKEKIEKKLTQEEKDNNFLKLKFLIRYISLSKNLKNELSTSISYIYQIKETQKTIKELHDFKKTIISLAIDNSILIKKIIDPYVYVFRRKDIYHINLNELDNYYYQRNIIEKLFEEHNKKLSISQI